jgi:hypothetical protein
VTACAAQHTALSTQHRVIKVRGPEVTDATGLSALTPSQLPTQQAVSSIGLRNRTLHANPKPEPIFMVQTTHFLWRRRCWCGLLASAATAGPDARAGEVALGEAAGLTGLLIPYRFLSGATATTLLLLLWLLWAWLLVGV